MKNTPSIVGGLTPACSHRTQDIYGRGCETLVSGTRLAGWRRCWRHLPLGHFARNGDLATVVDRMDIDIRKVVDVAATKPLGFMRFAPSSAW